MIMSGQMLLGWLGRKHNDAKATRRGRPDAEGGHQGDRRGQAPDPRSRRQGQHHARWATPSPPRYDAATTRSREDDHATHPDDDGGRARPSLPRADAGHGRLAADAADQDDLPVPGRRRHRPDRAHRRAAALQAARPAGLCREPRRRQRRARRPGGDAGRSRRLHHRRDLGFADDGQSVDVREARLPAAAGFHRGGADQSLPVDAGRQPLDRHQDRRRPDQGSPRKSPAR